MRRRPLGRTGLEVPEACLGTMTFGEQTTEAEGHAQLDLALERGVDFLDTAELYAIPPKAETQGATERIIGSWFAARPGARRRVTLATKVVGRTASTYYRDDGSPGCLDRAQVREAVDKSLARLRTDYIDLYQVHWPDRAMPGFGGGATVWKEPEPAPEVPILETLEALGEAVRAGKVRAVGLSNESAWGAMTYLHHAETAGLPRIASIQNAYSLLNRTFEVNLAEVCAREEVGLLAYSALAQGYLTGKYEGGALPQGSRKRLFNRMQRYETPGAGPAITAYLALAREAGIDPVHLALGFAASRPFVTSTILGATSLDQLSHALDAFDAPLPAEVLARIDAIHALHGNPCP